MNSTNPVPGDSLTSDDSNAGRQGGQTTAVQSSERKRNKIFISYRHEDSEYISGRVYDWLVRVQRISPKDVFKDVISTEPGDDFMETIEGAIKQCKIVLVIIGPNWFVERNTPSQYIQKEIELALQNGVKIIPVLSAGVRMPKSDELPESIRPFARRHAITIHGDPIFADDMKRLIAAIEPLPSKRGLSRRQLIIAGASAVAVTALGGVAVRYFASLSKAPRWKYTIPFTGIGDKDSGVLNKPAAVNGVVYVVAISGNMYALDARTGTFRWQTETNPQKKTPPDPKLITAPVVVSGATTSSGVAHDIVCSGSDNGGVCAFNSDTGALIWHAEIKSKAFSSPTVGGNMVYAALDDGNLYALDAASGERLWRASTGELAVPLSSPVLAEPTQADRLIFIASDDGYVYAFVAQNGAQRWRTYVNASVFSSPAVADGSVYVGSATGSVSALHEDTGERSWSTLLSANSVGRLSSPEVPDHDGIVYLQAEDGSIYALDAGNGKPRWKAPAVVTFFNSPAVARGAVFAGSSDGNLYVVDAGTGNQRETIDLKSGPLSSPVVEQGMIYVGAAAGTVFAVDI
jgi:outer membrane protein assembly factor BamB